MLEVAVGLLCNTDGQILVSRRPQNGHLPGLWEFPGGKLAAGEDPQQALVRELKEELDIEVLAAQPLLTLRHSYPEKTVRLHVFDVLRWRGEAHGAEGQQIQWVSDAKLNRLPLPAADRPILKALRLPAQYLITPDCPLGGQQQFLQQLERSLYSGAAMVQLRQTQMSSADLLELIPNCRRLCTRAGVPLIVNAAPELATQLPLDGLHLSSARLQALSAQKHRSRPVAADLLLGASCHNQTELQQALALDCDYVLLSPVKPTASHPDARLLGWNGFRELAQNCNLAVYALGGMRPEDQDQARANGAIGVAGSSAFWSAKP